MAPPIIARDEFCNSSKSVEKLKGGGQAAFFSNTCGSVVCQCYKRNRNEVLSLISDILVRFSQQKNQKFSARFARMSILASSLYHLGIIFVPPGLLSCLGKACSFISFFEIDLGTTSTWYVYESIWHRTYNTINHIFRIFFASFHISTKNSSFHVYLCCCLFS